MGGAVPSFRELLACGAGWTEGPGLGCSCCRGDVVVVEVVGTRRGYCRRDAPAAAEAAALTGLEEDEPIEIGGDGMIGVL